MSGRHGKGNKSHHKHHDPPAPKEHPEADIAVAQPEPKETVHLPERSNSKKIMTSQLFRKPDPFDIALWGMALTFAMGVIYYFQLRSMQDSVDLSRQALEVDQRPWLSVEAIPTQGLSFVNGKQAVLALKFSIKNLGKTIAKGIHIDAKMFPTPAGLPIALDALKKQNDLCDHPQPVPIRYDLFPTGQPMEQTLDISSIPSVVEAQAVPISSDKSRSFVSFYVVGCVTYNSSFNAQVHQTRFAYHLLRPIAPENGKVLTTSKGKPLMEGFEVGVNVPNGGFGMIQELFASNEAH